MDILFSLCTVLRGVGLSIYFGDPFTENRKYAEATLKLLKLNTQA
jgi:hypothetical protein